MPSEKPTIALRLPADLDDLVRTIAAEEQRSITQVCEILIRSGIARLKQKATDGGIVMQSIQKRVKAKHAK